MPNQFFLENAQYKSTYRHTFYVERYDGPRQSVKKQVRVTQCKRFPKPDKSVPFGGVEATFLLFIFRSTLHRLLKVNGWLLFPET